MCHKQLPAWPADGLHQTFGDTERKNLEIKDVHFSAENFAELIALIYTNRVNSTNALKILTIMAGSDKDKDPTHILEDKG